MALTRRLPLNDRVGCVMSQSSASPSFRDPMPVIGSLVRGLGALPVLHRFLPPPGWKHHLERVV